jgi:glycosyltransferase involved in cell wall biosynthesis
VGTRAASKSFRILLICDTYPPVLGGSEIEAQRVAGAMIRAGHRVQVLCSGGPPMPPQREWIDPNGSVPVSILTRRSRGRWKHFVFAFQVAREIWRRGREYDVVYFLMQGLHVASGLAAARVLRIPTVMKISGDGIISQMQRSPMGRIELRWLRQWKVPVMLLNESMIQEAMERRFARGQLIWMPNPVEITEFRPAVSGEGAEWRTSQGIPTSARVLIYVGRLSQEKGLVGLLKGFALASRADPEAMLVLVGDGAQRPELENLARDLSLGEQIRFTGRIDVSQVPFWLRAADVFALTSPNEGFPCALVEAMSAGLASVVSGIPANLQLVDDGVHGLTVPWNDENAIGRAVARLFDDPELRGRLGQAARQRVCDNYSTERIVERYEALMAKAIEGGH